MFTIKERIAAGGMAEVYRVEKTDPSGAVSCFALKRMLPGRDETLFVKALLREARVAADLDHPNIIKVVESGELQGSPFVLMEFIDGVDLAALLGYHLRKKLIVPLDVSLKILEDVAVALAYAHSRGVIHRDLSPPNILLSKTGQVKLTDFGIAKATSDTTRTPFGTLKGKLLYMSPEQLQGKELNHQTDLFSLGVVAHELFVGTRPFEGPTELKIIDRIRRHDVSFDTTVWKRLPARIADLCRRAMAQNLTERFTDGDAFVAAIRKIREALQLSDGTEPLRSIVQEAAQATGKESKRGERPPTIRTRKLEMHTITRGLERTAVLAEIPSKRHWRRKMIGLVAAIVVVIGCWSWIGRLNLQVHPAEIHESVTLPPTPSPQGRGNNELPGSLMIFAKPWGRVTIEGIKAGEVTPVTIGELAVGPYTVTVVYDPQGATSRQVSGLASVESQHSTRCSVNFLDAQATLRCRVE